MYQELFTNAKLWIDRDEDGELTTDETIQNNHVKLKR